MTKSPNERQRSMLVKKKMGSEVVLDSPWLGVFSSYILGTLSAGSLSPAISGHRAYSHLFALQSTLKIAVVTRLLGERIVVRLIKVNE